MDRSGSHAYGGLFITHIPFALRIAPPTLLPVDGFLADATQVLRMYAVILGGTLALALLAHGMHGIVPAARDRGTWGAFFLGVLLSGLLFGGDALIRISVGHKVLYLIGLILLLAAAWFGFLFLSFVLHAFVYSLLAGRGDADYVLVHGIKLRDDKVTPVLAARLDAGVAAWRDLAARHPGARLLVSGGREPEAPRAEATAMAEYAQTRGVPVDALLVEKTARNTKENLIFADELARGVLGSQAKDLSVTSRYHVPRTASLARHLGVPVRVLPSRTPWYRLLSGYLSEFGALIMLRPLLSMVTAIMVTFPIPVTIGYVLAVT